jgi:sugar phosphate isomerase/epimerase
MSIRDYAPIGIAYQMLYLRCATDPDFHAETLLNFVMRTDIDTFDFCIPYGDHLRPRCIEAVRNSGKTELGYAAILFPLRKISLGSLSRQEQEMSKLILKDQIDMAIACGAKTFNYASGIDVPQDRKKATQAFADMCCWICERLAPHNMTAIIEPFDREVDKKFLLGPSTECVDLVEQVRSKGFENIGFVVDMAHIPIMGETFDYALRTAKPYIKRLHIGNCVLKNKSDPYFGDSHAPMGYPGGENDVPELVQFLQACVSLGLITKRREVPVLFETQCFPNQSPDETMADQFDRLDQAWKMVKVS